MMATGNQINIAPFEKRVVRNEISSTQLHQNLFIDHVQLPEHCHVKLWFRVIRLETF